jgi:CheY-like chemotaxis protein
MTSPTAGRKPEPANARVREVGAPAGRRLDGRAVAAAVKAVDAHTTVILRTGWGVRLVAESDVPAGVDRVLSKPPRLPQLREALAAIVQTEEQR